MFVVELGQDLSLICLPVEFGQRLRHNLTNCGCLWSNWDETCHYLHLPVGFGQRLQRNLTNRVVRGQIGMRLVINCICLWDLGSASDVT